MIIMAGGEFFRIAFYAWDVVMHSKMCILNGWMGFFGRNVLSDNWRSGYMFML